MKKLQKSLIIGLIAVGTYAVAGSVTIPNSFTANTTAKASEVNANFSAVKTAVDGNAADVATNKNNISDNANDIATNAHDIAANEAAINQKVTNVLAGAGVDVNQTGNDVNISLGSDFITIHHSAFNVNDDKNCALVRNSWGSYFDTSSNSSCVAYAPVELPHGAQITKFGCWVKHNDSTEDAYIDIQFLYMDGLFAVGGNAATLHYNSTSSNRQYLEDDTIDWSYHDDEPAYFILYNPSAPNSAGTNEVILYCKIYYKY